MKLREPHGTWRGTHVIPRGRVMYEIEHTTVFFENGAEKMPVFLLKDLEAAQKIPGPALIIVLVDPSCVAEITSQGDVAISVEEERKESKLGVYLDTIQLSIFSHRFMSIADIALLTLHCKWEGEIQKKEDCTKQTSMAGPGKRSKKVDHEEPKEEAKLGPDDKEIQVDFEGQNPDGGDFHGIKRLLQQLFLKAHINLSQLADTIIEQNYIGSVLKQSLDDEEMADDEEDVADEVFGITTLLNLTKHKDAEFAKQIVTYLEDKCKEFSPSQVSQLNSLFSAPNHVGLLLNERFINIPPQVSVPLLENLKQELDNAVKQKKPFSVTHFILLSKLHRMRVNTGKKGKKKKNAVSYDVMWANPEDEFIVQEGDFGFEYSVKGESDDALTGAWTEDDQEMEPFRCVTVFSSSKLELLIDKIKAAIT
nr:EOG090X0C3Y [Lepidurus arcticus]